MEKNITQRNIVKTLVVFTVPLILSGLFQQLFNWVDAFILGNVEGELALASVGATTAVYNLFLTVMIGFTSGLAVYAAQQYGMEDMEQVNKILSSFAVLLGGIFLLTAVLGMGFTASVLSFLDTPADLSVDAERYLRILFAGIPFLAVYNVYSAVLRGIGDSRASFLAVLFCSAVNVCLDLVFVAGLRYGAAGAAAATVISQSAMTVFLVSYTVKKYPQLRFGPGKTMVEKEILAKGAAFGLPPAIQSGVSSAGSIVLQRFMNGFGEQTVAAITTAYRVDTVILLPIVNFGSGIATIVAQNIGAGSRERAKKTLNIGLFMIAVVSLCLTGFVIAAGEALIAMFGLTPQSVAIGKAFFHAIAVFYLIYGLAMAVRGYLEGTGDMLFSGGAGIASLVVRIAASYALVGVFGNMVIAYAEAIAWVFLLSVYCIRLRSSGRMKENR